jgi:uncharacterized repeat protein (TIGR02543 family)
MKFFKNLFIVLIFILTIVFVSCEENTTPTDETYSITWKNYDGSTLKTDLNVASGVLPIYDGATPTRQMSDANTYSFIGWNPSVVPANSNATYTAQYSEGIRTYLVTWLNYDDSVLKVDNVAYGAEPSYLGTTPLKPETPQYSYEFSGWFPSVVNVTSDATYRALFTQSVNSYTITWLNYDDSLLYSESVNYGIIPTFKGSTPTKESDGSFIYTFKEWTPTIVSVTTNASYKATFDAKSIDIIPDTFSVTWKNYDGSTIKIDTNLTAGSMPVYVGDTPTRASSISTTYLFSGWTPTIVVVSANAVYTATYSESVNQYTITWKNYDNSVLATSLVNYGLLPSYSGSSPVKPNTSEFSYLFSGWTPTIVVVSANAVYTATYSESVNQYTITFNSNGGSSIDSIVLSYGTILEELLTNPTKPGYVFVAWCTDSQATIPVIFPLTITSNVTLYASWNEQIDLMAYLTALLGGYELNPYQYIPSTMRVDSNVILEAQTALLDYSSFVNISDILYGGYGEQWEMVLDNLEQTKIFFNVLSVVEAISATAVTGFNNYIDSNPGNSAQYTFLSGIYTVTINIQNSVISFVIDYTASLPILGVQIIQIALTYNIETSQRTGRIQLGEANALKYVITDNSYSFGIRYLGVRRAYFEISEDQHGNVNGAIFEFLGVDGLVSTTSAAQFYITDQYVSVVGNKAGSMLGWSGYINELYKTDEGKLLGYEVQEKLSVITYNTLWFNLNDVVGITSIKALSAPIQEANPNLIYVNGNNTLFVAKKVGGIGTKMTSRRYDIEFRTQYFYYLSGDEYIKVAISVPMLFVQEEQLGTLSSDITSSNSQVVSFSLLLSTDIQNKIKADYLVMIPIFITNKENFSAEDVLIFIGSNL